MRAIVFSLALLVAFGPISDSPPLLQQNQLQKLSWALSAWSDHKTLGPFAIKVRGQLRVYSSWQHQAEAIARRDTLTLHVIGQIHTPPDSDRTYRRQVLSSQRQVFDLLTRLKPSLVSLEGYTKDTLNTKALLSDIALQEKHELFLTQGAIKFLARHDSLPAVGADDPALHDLCLAILKIVYGSDRPQNLIELDALNTFLWITIDARSQLAVDRTVIGLDRRHLHQAAMVIGGDHRSICLAEGRRIGITIEYFPTDK